MSTLNPTARGLILRTVDAPTTGKRKRTGVRRLIVTVAIVLMATLGVLGGSGLGNGANTPAANAAGFLDFCANPAIGQAPAPAVNISALGSSDASAASKTIAASAQSGGNDGSSQLTAFEWYGVSGMKWNNWGWDAFPENVRGCTNLLNGLNFLNDIVFGLNTMVGIVSINVIAWMTTWNVVSLFFTDAGGVLPNIVTGLKDALFLNYLAPIVMFSALFLAYRGLVKRASREAIQGVVWMFGAAAAALMFMTNPVWFAKTADDVVTATSSFIIESSVSVTAAGGNGMCSLPEGTTDRGVREIQCSLWQTFIYTPWASGQVGESALDVKVNGATSSFRAGQVDQTLPLLVLDTQTYNAVQSKASSLGTAQLSSFDAGKKTTWDAVGTTMTDKNNTDAVAGWSYWTGVDVTGRFGVALVALVAQFAASIPLLVLSFGMLAQQIIFVLMLTLAPIFLTIGINPGYGRRVSLGWLEVVLSTLVKRVVLAAMIGVLLAYFGAVITANTSGLPVVGWLFNILLLAVGAVAILIMRGKLLKQATDFIELNGVRPTDNGRTRMIMAGIGGAALGATVGGAADKAQGGSFFEGAGKRLAGSATRVVDAVPGGAQVRGAVGDLQGARRSTLDGTRQAMNNEAELAFMNRIAEQRGVDTSSVYEEYTALRAAANENASLRATTDFNKEWRDDASSALFNTDRQGLYAYEEMLRRSSLDLETATAAAGNAVLTTETHEDPKVADLARQTIMEANAQRARAARKKGKATRPTPASPEVPLQSDLLPNSDDSA